MILNNNLLILIQKDEGEETMPIKDCFTTKNVIFIIFGTAYSKIHFPNYGNCAFIFCIVRNIVLTKPNRRQIREENEAAYCGNSVLCGTLGITFAFFIPIIFVAIKQVQGFITILPEKIDLIQDFIFNHQFYGHRLPEIMNLDSIIKNTKSFLRQDL